MTIIILTYLFIPFLLTYGATSLAGITTPAAITGVEDLPELDAFAMTLALLATITFFAAIFIIPMAMMVYAATENIKEAFNIPVILEKIVMDVVSYLRAYMFSLAMFILFLLVLPFVSVFMGFVMINPALFSVHIFAQAFKKVV